MVNYQCNECGKNFTLSKNLKRHQRLKHDQSTIHRGGDLYSCGFCDVTYSRSDALKRHLRTQHEQGDMFKCFYCRAVYGTRDYLLRHVRENHDLSSVPKTPETDNVQFLPIKESRSAINGYFQTYRFDVGGKSFDPLCLLHAQYHNIKQFVEDKAREIGSLKFHIVFKIKLAKPLQQERDEQLPTVSFFGSSTLPVFVGTGLDERDFYQLADQIQTHLNIYCNSGSGFVIDKILSLDINISKYKPIRGSSYIPTPLFFSKCQALLNIQNNDQSCFLYCLAAALFPGGSSSFSTTNTTSSSSSYKRKVRPKTYRMRFKHFTYNEQDMPMCVANIPKFEKKNNLRINVFGWDGCAVAPLHISRENINKKLINLLLLSDDIKFHYCLITNIHSFLAYANRVKYRGSHTQRRYCERCLNSFWSKSNLQEHLELCGSHEPIRIRMPHSGRFVQYENLHKELPVPFVVYADLEAMSVSIAGVETNPSTSGSRVVEKQIPCSCGLTLLNPTGDIIDTFIYHGTDCITKMLDKLRIWARACRCLKQFYRVLHIEPSEKRRALDNAVNCCICGDDFSSEPDGSSGDPLQPVLHHCHVTGKIYGVAHSKCNMKVRTQAFLPVLFHNLSRVSANRVCM